MGTIIDFIVAALPWVVMGLAIVALTFQHNRRKEKADVSNMNTDTTENKKNDNYMSEGLAIGMCLGSGVGASGLINLGTSISIGMLLGMVIGMMIQKME